LDSMKSIQGFSGSADIRIVASNHLAYFREKLIQKENFLKIKIVTHQCKIVF